MTCQQVPDGVSERVAEHAGDMPVALMFDGPSLGGFVCPCTITSTELWKMGQVSPNDSVLFKPVTLGERPLPCWLTLLKDSGQQMREELRHEAQ